jgi:hypothetical protein
VKPYMEDAITAGRFLRPKGSLEGLMRPWLWPAPVKLRKQREKRIKEDYPTL